MNLEVAATGAVSESVARLLGATGRDGDVLAPALRRLDWVAALPNAAAPGFVYLAGACGGLPVGGGGRSLAEAAGKLAGEASETLAGMSSRGLVAPSGLPVDPGLAEIQGAGPAVLGASLIDSRPVALPAAAIYRDIEPVAGAPPRSLGAGAGATREAALLSGLLELVERDAAAAWWGGATRPRAVGAEEAAGAAATLADLRAGAPRPGRATFFLMLPSPTGLPVVAALSRDGGGRTGGVVVGLKAALAPDEALVGAMLELLQMEIGLEIVRLRAQAGRAAPEDAATLRRAAVDLDDHAAFAPLPPLPASGRRIEDLDGLVAQLARLGIEPMAVDLDGPPGIAVAKVFAPGLLPMPGPGPLPAAGAPATVADLF